MSLNLYWVRWSTKIGDICLLSACDGSVLIVPRKSYCIVDMFVCQFFDLNVYNCHYCNYGLIGQRTKYRGVLLHTCVVIVTVWQLWRKKIGNIFVVQLIHMICLCRPWPY